MWPRSNATSELPPAALLRGALHDNRRLAATRPGSRNLAGGIHGPSCAGEQGTPSLRTRPAGQAMGTSNSRGGRCRSASISATTNSSVASTARTCVQAACGSTPTRSATQQTSSGSEAEFAQVWQLIHAEGGMHGMVMSPWPGRTGRQGVSAAGPHVERLSVLEYSALRTPSASTAAATRVRTRRPAASVLSNKGCNACSAGCASLGRRSGRDLGAGCPARGRRLR
jgi:hypothetical protein